MKSFPGEIRRVGRGHRYELTDEQREWFLKWYPSVENRRLARAMGVYVDRVRLFARELGVVKSEIGMRAIRRRRDIAAARTNERNGCFDRKRGRPVSEATREGQRRRWERVRAGELDSPIVRLRKTYPERYRNMLERKSRERSESIRKEKLRVAYGLERKTRLKAVVICPYTRSQSHRRCSALKRGYLLDYDCSEGTAGRYTLYYDEQTERSEKFESNCIKDGFKIEKA